MQLIFSRLYYEVILENPFDNKTFSRLFSFYQPLRCRELALTYFLEMVLSDDFDHKRMFLTMYVRHKSGERVEIINSQNYQQVEENLDGLTRELELYKKEKIKAPVAVYNKRQPHQITILHENYKKVHHLQTSDTVITLAADYSVFFRGRKEKFLIA